ncbi:MAG TPA: type II toxin-antitoxin system RelE/ParE family toxin [Gemmata sp.]
MSVVVSPTAQADVVATALWYEQQPGRHGDAFNDAVRDAIRAIGSAPQRFPLVEDGVPKREIREFFIERFRRRVIYQVNGNDVLVLAVVHASRRPGAWHRNIPTDPPAETP